MSSLSFDVKTFGCKVNTYDAGLLQKRLIKAGFFSESREPSIHIVNTCAVTHEATKEAMKHIRRIKAKNPFSTVVVTGCAAQVDGKYLDNLPGADLIIANSHKGELESILTNYLKGDRSQKVFRSNIFRNEKLGEGGGEELGHTRSFLKIQDGCNSFCTFCIIPYARGKSRSLSVPYLVNKINELYEQGVREVVLTGVHIGDYVDEETQTGPYKLEDMLAIVLEQTSMPRLRLTSLEPIELNEKLMALFKNPRLCPHFHMSIQSAHTRVLKDMKRKYTAEQVQDSLRWIATDIPHAFVGMDVIVGFPGESDEDFRETYNRLAQSPWTRIHVFPYSERSGTRAALSEESVPQEIRKLRARCLRELSLERYKEKALEQVGDVKRVLLLKSKNQGMRGLSRDYWPIEFINNNFEDSQLGTEVSVKITGVDISQPKEGPLFGEILQ